MFHFEFRSRLCDQKHEILKAFILACLRCGFVFATCYYPSDWLAEQASSIWIVSMHWELSTPYHPLWFLPYFSAFAVVALLPFYLRTPGEIFCWEKSTVLAILFATPFFLLFPTKSGYLANDNGIFSPLYEWAILISRHHNLFPSLHVALSFIAINALKRNVGPRTSSFFTAWLVLIAASTLLTHQHHAIDIPAGILLGWFCVGIMKRSTAIQRKQRL
jgi:membrane-associated phospholipid phosphatase